MKRMCQKCGSVKEDADMSAAEACPRCGAIYSKASIAAAAARSAEQARPPSTARTAETSQSSSQKGGGKIAWTIALLGSFAGLYELINTSALAQSAPQQAAGAAMALAYAAIPYCMARAIQMLMR